MHLRGKLAKLMAKVAPGIYTKYALLLTAKKGKTVLLMHPPSQEHSTTWQYEGCSSLLIQYQLVKDLESISFKINSYDPSVANKTWSKGKNLPLFGMLTI